MAAPPRTLHDKTSYSILPTPPSPTRNITSPSPSLSPSTSNSAGSSTEPTTPPTRPRGRTRNLYPDSIGRVPLHRRGTSKTYERLEDLLREAGYKETRIFTPETERTAPQDDAKSPTIGASFVGFLSGLVPSRSASLKRGDDVEVYSPPSTPSVNRTPRPSGSHATRASTSQQFAPRRNSNAVADAVQQPRRGSNAPRRNSNAVADAEAVRRRGNTAVDPPLTTRRSAASMHHQSLHSLISPVPRQPGEFEQQQQQQQQRAPNRYYQHHPSSSRASNTPASPPQIFHPTPTRASSYLRHMTSYDRAQSTPPSSSAHTPAYTYTRHTDDAEDESALLSPTLPPRMPAGWLDNVKRAREYFVVPPVPPLPPIVGSPAANKSGLLARSVSDVKGARGRLKDRTNSAHALAPPLLTARLSTGRARRSESVVSTTRVVCRSRGSSPVRHGKGKAREQDLELRGRLEDELVLVQGLEGSRFLGGWGTQQQQQQFLTPPARRDDDGESVSDVSSEGEEELTLARLLVPSRREQESAPLERSRSVRSLRKCLELDGQAGEVPPPVPPLPSNGNGPGSAGLSSDGGSGWGRPLSTASTGSGRWSVSLSWGRAKAQRVEGEEEGEDPFLSTKSANTKSGKGERRRSAMPSWEAI
ncbi:hypothetical protein C8J57DRAFT_1592717 [Mycena rebaudengoi]|nr:hypothetical protein C8J57DRAFT_1592717 [Mycena rebaudengoi]